MKVYRINNEVFPGVNFNFVVTASDLHFAPATHTHEMSEVTALNSALATKSNSTHTHVCVNTLYTTTPGVNDHSVSLTVVRGSISVDQNTITIDYVSQQAGAVDCIKNENTDASECETIKIGMNIDGFNENNDATAILEMEGSVYA